METRKFWKQGYSLFLFYYGMFPAHPRSCNNDRLETSYSLSKNLFSYAFTKYSAQRATPSRNACNTNSFDINFGTFLAQRPGNDGNEAGFTRGSWQCFYKEMQTPKCDFEPLSVYFFEEHESPPQNAYKPNAFQ